MKFAYGIEMKNSPVTGTLRLDGHVNREALATYGIDLDDYPYNPPLSRSEELAIAKELAAHGIAWGPLAAPDRVPAPSRETKGTLPNGYEHKAIFIDPQRRRGQRLLSDEEILAISEQRRQQQIFAARHALYQRLVARNPETVRHQAEAQALHRMTQARARAIAAGR